MQLLPSDPVLEAARSLASTADERRRVFELADRGLSSRRVAQAVFGDPGLKDRVLELLRLRSSAETAAERRYLEGASTEELQAHLEATLAALD